MNVRIFAIAAGVALLTGATGPAGAHGDQMQGMGAADQGGTGTDGVPGKAADVDRTVRIEARDTAFNVAQIQVRAGETVRFVVTNAGKLRHEFVIASHKEHLEHRAMMQQMPDMTMGGEPNAVTVDPGQTKELLWKFGKDTDVEFACDIPGHAEQGIAGTFRVVR